MTLNVCDAEAGFPIRRGCQSTGKECILDTFTEIAAKWAQQAEEVSEIVDAVALPSDRHATLSDENRISWS